MPCPFAVIIGAPRAGSTTLFFQLQSHPQVCGPTANGRLIKETDYLCNIAAATPEGYRNLWRPSSQSRVLLEASPNYTAYPYVSGIAEFLGTLSEPVKIICLLRDPVDRIASHYRTKGLYPKTLSSDQDYLSELLKSDYWLQLSQYRQFYERGDMLLLSFKDLRLDQHSVFEKTCDFLGLDSACTREWLGRLSHMHANLSVDNANPLTGMRNSLLLQQLKKNVPLSIKISWKNLERSLSTKIPVINRPSGWKPDVDSIEQIKRTLRPNMYRLADDFDVDINAWFGDGWLN